LKRGESALLAIANRKNVKILGTMEEMEAIYQDLPSIARLLLPQIRICKRHL
jgi:hypothetical protein